MIKTHFFLDCRRSKAGAPGRLTLVLSLNSKRALIPLDFSALPENWDAKRQIFVKTPSATILNAALMERKVGIDAMLYRMQKAGELNGMDLKALRALVAKELRPECAQKTGSLFMEHFARVVEVRSEGNRRNFMATARRLRAWLGVGLDSLTFDDIDVPWLRSFDEFLAKTSPARNARNIHFRNIRTVFNDAIANGLTTAYPFRLFKIKPERTRKRSLSVEVLRALWNLEPEETHLKRYLDCFKITFGLCGINIVDLCGLRELHDGRAEYQRAKTHRPYSIKVEPEVSDLLKAHRGEKWLLNYCDTCGGYRSFYTRLNSNLKKIGEAVGVKGLSTYWARHTWATIAASLDIPKETIAAALGHGGNTVTDIYIDFDRGKIDRANRAVLDWVLYGRRTPWWCDYDAPYAMPAGVPSAQPAPYGHGGAYYSQEAAPQEDAVEEAAPAAPVARRRGRPRKAVGAGDVDCKSVGADTPKSVDGVPGAPAVARLHKSCRVAPVVDVDCALDDDGDAVGRGRVAACAVVAGAVRSEAVATVADKLGRNIDRARAGGKDYCKDGGKYSKCFHC